MPRCLAGPLLIVALAASPCARADIFSYTDSQGVAHFSNVPTDSRFSLLLTSPREDTPASVIAKPGVNWLARAEQFTSAISNAAKANTVPAALVKAVIVVESGFNPRAVSKKGAAGLMQLQPQTARRYGVKDIYDPEQNIRAGAHYLSDLLVRYNSNLEFALAAYNAGEHAVERYGRHVPPFAETQSYVPNVMRIYRRLTEEAASRT